MFELKCVTVLTPSVLLYLDTYFYVPVVDFYVIATTFAEENMKR